MLDSALAALVATRMFWSSNPPLRSSPAYGLHLSSTARLAVEHPSLKAAEAATVSMVARSRHDSFQFQEETVHNPQKREWLSVSTQACNPGSLQRRDHDHKLFARQLGRQNIGHEDARVMCVGPRTLYTWADHKP